MRTIRLTFLCLVLLHPAYSQKSDKETRDGAISLITDVFFNNSAEVIRQQHRSFENDHRIKLHFTVDDESIDQLGGLSEYLFKIYKTLVNPVNVNRNTITGEFSLLQEGVLSDLISFRSAATQDLRACRFPQAESDAVDSACTQLFRHQSQFFETDDYNSGPELIGTVLQDVPERYEEILVRHDYCSGLSDDQYDQYVRATTEERSKNWLKDIGFSRAHLYSNFAVLQGWSASQVNAGCVPCASLNIGTYTISGTHVIDLNQSISSCSQGDLEARSVILHRETNIRFMFLTHSISYFIPRDSLELFLNQVTEDLNDQPGKTIAALYLEMRDLSGNVAGPLLLVKQLNGEWLSKADITFDNANNGMKYNDGTYWKFRNLYKNIPKPLRLYYQIAKVNGVVTTMSVEVGRDIKGKEQVSFHQFEVDEAFDELVRLRSKIAHVTPSKTDNTEKDLAAFEDRIDHENRFLVEYLKALHSPKLKNAGYSIKEIYLNDPDLITVSALQYLKSRGYDALYQNDNLDKYSHVQVPKDLHQGTCPVDEKKSDVIGTMLDVASLVLMPTGLDIVPDLVSVAYYAAKGQQSNMYIAMVGVASPFIFQAAKYVSNGAQAVNGLRKGAVLAKKDGQLQLVTQEIGQIKDLLKLEPGRISQQFSEKVLNSSTPVKDLLSVDLAQARIFSNALEHLDEPKRFEFINKFLDDAGFRTKVLSDPDEVLRWGGEYGRWLNDLEGLLGAGTKAKIIKWINEGLDPKKIEKAFFDSKDMEALFANLENAKSVYHQRVYVKDYDNIPGIIKTPFKENGLSSKLTHPGWNDQSLDLLEQEAKTFVWAVPDDLPAGTKLYRVTDGNSSGGYWTLVKPTKLSEVVGGTAVRPEWNNFQRIYEYEVPSGNSLKVWRGPAAAQKISEGIMNPHLPGGLEQIFIPAKLRTSAFKNHIKELSIPW